MADGEFVVTLWSERMEDELFRGGGGYPVANAVSTQVAKAAFREPTTRERIDAEVERARQRLADAEEAKRIMDSNPDLERLLDIMQRNSSFNR